MELQNKSAKRGAQARAKAYLALIAASLEFIIELASNKFPSNDLQSIFVKTFSFWCPPRPSSFTRRWLARKLYSRSISWDQNQRFQVFIGVRKLATDIKSFCFVISKTTREIKFGNVISHSKPSRTGEFNKKRNNSRIDPIFFRFKQTETNFTFYSSKLRSKFYSYVT